jgi:hypothetical protein
VPPERIDLGSPGNHRHFIISIPRDGETQEKKEPVADPTGPPVILGRTIRFILPKQNPVHGAGHAAADKGAAFCRRAEMAMPRSQHVLASL